MATKCCVLVNVPVPVLLWYLQGIFHNNVNCFSIDSVSNKCDGN